MILQCGNPECKKWQHLKCIAEAAAKQAADDAGTKKPGKQTKPKTLSLGARSLAQAKAQALLYTAEVFVEGLPKSDELIPSDKTEVIVTDGDGEKSTQPVCCLFCGHEIE